MADKTVRISEKPLLHLFVLLLLCVTTYSNTFDVPFILDDDDSIVDNGVIRDLDHFFNDSTGYDYNPSRYIGYLTFAVNYAIGGLDVGGYHVFNLLIHIAHAMLVYALVVLTSRTPKMKASSPYPYSRSLAFFTAAIFAVHPLQTQAVTYIVQRLTSLTALFYVLSLCLYVRARLDYDSGGSWRAKPIAVLPYISSLVAAILAMKTKEIAFTLPFVVVLYELLFFEGGMRKRSRFLVPVLLTLFIIPLSLLHSQRSLGEIISDVSDVTRVQTTVSRLDYLRTQFCVINTYIRLIFIPYGQNLDYNYPIARSFWALPVLRSFILLLALLATALLAWSKSRNRGRGHLRLISFGILWFFIALSVESSIIPIVDVIFEHRMYLPSVGAILAVVAAAGSIVAGSAGMRRSKVVTTISAAVVLGLSIVAFQRNSVWGSAVSLWEDTVKKSPGKARPLIQLGTALSSQGRNDEAVGRLVEAIRVDPANARAYNNLGIALSRKGAQDQAESMFSKAIAIEPDFGLAYYNLGRIYLIHSGEYDRAIALFSRAIELKPHYRSAAVNLAAAYNQKGEFDHAVHALETLIPISERGPEACYNLGLAYAGLGDVGAANAQLERLRKMDARLASRLEGVIFGARDVER